MSDIKLWIEVLKEIQLAFVTEDPEDIPEADAELTKLLIQVSGPDYRV